MSNKNSNEKVEQSWQIKIIKYLAFSIVFFIPLYTNFNHWFPFSTPKTIILLGLIVSMLILYLWSRWGDYNLKIRFNLVGISLSIFLLILNFSSLFGIDLLNSFFGLWSQSISMVLIYALAIFAFIIGSIIRKDKEFLIHILLASFLSSVCVAIVSYFGNSILEISNGGSTIGNSSYAGAYLLLNFSIGIGLLFYFKKYWQKIFIAISLFIIFLTPLFFNNNILLGKVGLTELFRNPMLILGVANGATLGLIASLIFIICFFLINSSKRFIKIIGAILLFSSLFFSCFVAYEFGRTDSFIYKMFVEEKGINRIIAWDSASSSLREKPLLGSGFNNYSYNYQKYFKSEIFKKDNNPEFYFNQPHNVVWEFASNNGLLGLIAYLFLLFSIFFAFYKKRENEERRISLLKIALIGGLFGYFIQNLFGFDTPVTYMMFFLFVGVALGLCEDFYSKNLHHDFILLKRVFISVYIFLSVVAFVLFVIMPWQESVGWGKVAKAKNLEQFTLLQDGMDSKSLFGGIADRSYLIDKFLYLHQDRIKNIESKDKELFVSEISSLVQQLEESLKKQPNDMRAHLLIGKLLNESMLAQGKKDKELWSKAINHLNIALLLNSQNPEIYFTLSQTHLINRDLITSRRCLRQAILIAPEYKKSYKFADKLQSIVPDRKFGNFLEKMKTEWGIDN